MKNSIRTKLLSVIVIGIVLLSVIFYFASLEAQRSNLNNNALDHIKSAKKTFYSLEESDIDLLKVAVTHFMENDRLRRIFTEGNREALYNSGQELFNKNKAFGITHFYFHRKDGTVFSRLHDRNKYDDNVTRRTFEQSKQTNSWGSGIELGQTAFALRVVHPYYANNELVGYIEFGEEIDHFIDIMKEQTNHEYAIVVRKKYIDSLKWASVRASKGLENNYNEMQEYVIIDTTMKSTALFKEYAFSDSNLKSVSDEGVTFGLFETEGKSYASGGFTLYDAGHEKVGAVITIEDISEAVEFYKKSNLQVLLITAIGGLLICIIIIYLLTKMIINPIKKVVDTTVRVAGGDFSAKIDVHSNDEIGTLATMLEGFKDIMVHTAQQLEEARKR